MSECSEIRDICGDYAFDVEYHANNEFTMFFNSYRNAKTVKRCIEVDDSVPNVATAVDFVEVVRCKDCKFCRTLKDGGSQCERIDGLLMTKPDDYCSYGERREECL